MKLKSPALFRRVPIPRAPKSEPLLPDKIETDEYKDLASDITIVRAKLFDEFKKLDIAALKRQNVFRLVQFLMIVGGLIATLLGSIQAAFPHSHWAGIAEFALIGVLIVVFVANALMNPRQRYLDERLKAERLRAECFYFLACVGQYSARDETNSGALLEQQVKLIAAGSPQ